MLMQFIQNLSGDEKGWRIDAYILIPEDPHLLLGDWHISETVGKE